VFCTRMPGISDYEKVRQENIARNAAALRALGLDPVQLTTPATGKRAALPASRRRRRLHRAAIARERRRSARIASLAEVQGTPNYEEHDSDSDEAAKKRSRPAEPWRRTRRRSARQRHNVKDELPTRARSPDAGRITKRKAGSSRANVGTRSCRVMQADVAKLQSKDQLGRFVKAATTQIKASVMQHASLTGAMPTFSRMSGIQEWSNAVMLFVNVYGDGYKNVFLNGGFVLLPLSVPTTFYVRCTHYILEIYSRPSGAKLRGSHNQDSGKEHQSFGD